jgi:hypothetical protein
MGTWGVGMQSNDTALDAIDDGRKKPLETLKKNIDEWMKDDEFNSGMKSILGLAEYCLDKGKKPTPDLIKKIKVIIKKAKATAESFRDPKERLGALRRFEARLNGKKVDERDLMLDNMGLFGSMEFHGKSRKEIKKLLVKV